MKNLLKFPSSGTLLAGVIVFLSAASFAHDLTVQVVYDPVTFKGYPGYLPIPGVPPVVNDFNGMRFVVFARLYPEGTYKNCNSGCGFSNGVPDPGYIGVSTCSGWFITSAMNPIFLNLGSPNYSAAVQGVVGGANTGVPFVRATGTYEFGATLDANGNIHGNGKNIIVTDGYLSIPDVLNKSSLITYRPVTGGSGTFKGLMLDKPLSASNATTLGFFQNGRGFLTENVVFHLNSLQNNQ